jgi:hypothetical protein
MTGVVIPFDKPKELEPKCSFCGTPKSKAKKMVSTTDGMRHICDKCIVKAKQRLQEGA